MGKKEMIEEIVHNDHLQSRKHLSRLPVVVLKGQLEKYRKYNPDWEIYDDTLGGFAKAPAEPYKNGEAFVLNTFYMYGIDDGMDIIASYLMISKDKSEDHAFCLQILETLERFRLNEEVEIGVMQKILDSCDRETSAEVLAEILTDDSIGTYDVVEDLMSAYAKNNADFRAGMDTTLSYLFGCELDVIINRIMAKEANK